MAGENLDAELRRRALRPGLTPSRRWRLRRRRPRKAKIGHDTVASGGQSYFEMALSPRSVGRILAANSSFSRNSGFTPVIWLTASSRPRSDSGMCS